MNILTKDWAKSYEQVQELYRLGFLKRGSEVLKELESRANKAILATQDAENHLCENFMLDDIVCGVGQGEYVKGKDYFIKINNHCICIENYKILERENFNIKNTYIYSAELYYVSNNCYELHLLLSKENNGASQKYYFTLSGSFVKLKYCGE